MLRRVEKENAKNMINHVLPQLKELDKTADSSFQFALTLFFVAALF